MRNGANGTPGAWRERAGWAEPEDAEFSPPPAGHFIPASASLEERRTRTLKHGDTFGVFDPNGDAIPGPGNPSGLYYRDTRHLSALSLSLCGARPLLLGSNLHEDNATLSCDLTNPDIYDADGGLLLDHDLIHVRRSRFLWDGVCFDHLAVRNYSMAPQDLAIAVTFAADFADVFEVRGARRAERGIVHPPAASEAEVTLSYSGLDGRRRETRLRFDPVPRELSATRAVFFRRLEPGAAASFFIEICCRGQGPCERPRQAFLMGLRQSRRSLRAFSQRTAAAAASNGIFNETFRRSVSDLCMLITDTPHGPYPYAGVPWFSTVFGRDALITALETLWFDPALARGVLCHLAANQADAEDPGSDAEPGKILHEMRQGEMAELGEVPFRRYYGTADATPLFIMLAGAYERRTGDLATVHALWPSLKAALAWIDTTCQRRKDGFLAYRWRGSEGLVNQGWKDSHDSVFHAGGELAQGSIALCEVQAYVYGAWRAAAALARRLGEKDFAASLEARSEEWRNRFDAAFWDEALGTYVLALDGEGAPCRVRTSNAGHVLFTGLARHERAGRIVSALMARSSWSGWGIRTLASTEARYNPMSYHNGSVWPHDNALIAAGFRRYGFRREALQIFEGLFAAAAHMELRRLPELFCGFPRQRSRGPTLYPVACTPQAWAAAAPLFLLQTSLGLDFDPGARRIVFDQPLLPRFLDDVTLYGLELQGGRANVTVARAGPEVTVTVHGRSSDVRVLTAS